MENEFDDNEEEDDDDFSEDQDDDEESEDDVSAVQNVDSYYSILTNSLG